jgi:predicted transcriptional regulator
MKEKTDTATVAVRIPATAYARLEELAAEMHVKRSDILRTAILAFLRMEENGAE